MSTSIEGITLVTSNCCCFYIWEWESAPGVWNCYSPLIMIELEGLQTVADEAATRSNSKGDTVKRPTYAFITIGEVQYLIDVKTCAQTRLDTSTRRRIRRTRIAGSWTFKGEGTIIEADQTSAATIEYHRREHSSSKVFDVKMRHKKHPKTLRFRVDLNIMTWTFLPSRMSTAGEQEDVGGIDLSGTLERILPPPPLLPRRKHRGRLWVPKEFCSHSSCTSPSLPPFPSVTSPIDWRAPPTTLQWGRDAPFPSLGVKWNVPPASKWTSLFCLAYGRVTYQALLETDNRSRVLDDAVVLRDKSVKTSSPIDPNAREEGTEGLPGGHCYHDEECRICSENTATETTVECARCNFRYCEDCFDAWLRPSGGRPGVQCPQCKIPIADTRGTQPSGWLEWWILPPGLLPVPGHETHATLLLNYDFPDGEQISGHLNPGAPFRGDQRVGFFPYCPETAGLLPLFLQCFSSGRTFTVGESLTTGEQNTLIWGGIHHKTSVDENAAHGYPDASYFKRVEEELRAQHVHPTTDDTRTLLSGNPAPLGISDYAKDGRLHTMEKDSNESLSRPKTGTGQDTDSGRSTPSEDATSIRFLSPSFEISVSETLNADNSSCNGLHLLRRGDATSWDASR